MAKRAGIARAMALDPPLLFLDEPSAGLDPITSAGLDRLILDLRLDLGATFVVVTHELASILAIADRCIMLDRPRLSRRRRRDRRGRSAPARATAARMRASARSFIANRCRRRCRLMGGRASSLRVGLLIIGGIVLLLALVWFLRGGQVNNGTTVRHLLHRVGAGVGGRIEGGVSRRDDRAGHPGRAW